MRAPQGRSEFSAVKPRMPMHSVALRVLQVHFSGGNMSKKRQFDDWEGDTFEMTIICSGAGPGSWGDWEEKVDVTFQRGDSETPNSWEIDCGCWFSPDWDECFGDEDDEDEDDEDGDLEIEVEPEWRHRCNGVGTTFAEAFDASGPCAIAVSIEEILEQLPDAFLIQIEQESQHLGPAFMQTVQAIRAKPLLKALGGGA
jgi:hypothetical protein